MYNNIFLKKETEQHRDHQNNVFGKQEVTLLDIQEIKTKRYPFDWGCGDKIDKNHFF